MISREDVETAVRDISTFIADLGDAPMGGRHAAAVEWERAKAWIVTELDFRDQATV